jgi:uncharacterized OB-fold protein
VLALAADGVIQGGIDSSRGQTHFMGQKSISEQILELGTNGPRLIGSRCRNCGNHVFPASTGCPRCAGFDMERATLGTEGELWAWTVQGFPPKSPPYLGESDPKKFQPYGVGYITLPGQCKVEARLTEADSKRLREGMRMRLTTVPLRRDAEGNDLVTFAFEPVESRQQEVSR